MAEDPDGCRPDVRLADLRGKSTVNGDDSEISGLERLLGRLMLIGVTISGVSLATGLVLWLTSGRGTRLLEVGLIALMGTPMLRVAVSLIEAVRRRDWFFVGATLAV